MTHVHSQWNGTTTHVLLIWFRFVARQLRPVWPRTTCTIRYYMIVYPVSTRRVIVSDQSGSVLLIGSVRHTSGNLTRNSVNSAIDLLRHTRRIRLSHVRVPPARFCLAVRMSSKPDLWLIRHGETEWSKTGQHTGVADIPLTANGQQQAQHVKQCLNGRHFQLVLCSPRQRARDTCAIAGYAEQAHVENGIDEYHYGEFEGRTTDEIHRTHPSWTIWDGPTPGGETIDGVAQRATAVIERCLAAKGDGPIALFAHGHVLRIFTACWLGLGGRDGRLFALDTATISVLGWERQQRVVRKWNFLPPLRHLQEDEQLASQKVRPAA